MGDPPVLSPLWKIIRIYTKYYALDHSMTYQCYLHEKHMFWLFCSDSFDGLSISGHGKSYPGKIVTIWYVNGQNSKNLSKSNFRICPWSTFMGPILGHRSCRRLGMHQQIIWDTLKGSIWPHGAIPSLHGPYLLHPPYFGPWALREAIWNPWSRKTITSMTKVVGRINTLKHMYFDVLKRKIQKSHFLSFLWGQIWSKCPHKPNLLCEGL